LVLECFSGLPVEGKPCSRLQSGSPGITQEFNEKNKLANKPNFKFPSVVARSIASNKGKSDGSQVKESTDSSTTLEDDDSKGKATGTLFLPRHTEDRRCRAHTDRNVQSSSLQLTL
jgi:hypothetical protein